MITINKKIFINAPPEKVWKVFSNLNNWPKLNPMHKYARFISENHWHVDSKFEFYTDYGLIKSKTISKILKSNPPFYVEWTGTKPFIKGKHSFVFKKIKNGTEVTNHEEFTGIGLPLVHLLNLKPRIEQSFTRFLKGLKLYSERKTWL